VLLPAEALAALRLARRLQQEQGSEGGRSAAATQVATLGTHLSEMDGEEAAQLAALAAIAQATWTQAAAEAALAAGGASGGGEEDGGISTADVLEALCRLQINGLAVVPPERRGSGDRLSLALYPVGWGSVQHLHNGLGNLQPPCVKVLSPAQLAFLCLPRDFTLCFSVSK
jgi:hypothetical protein